MNEDIKKVLDNFDTVWQRVTGDGSNTPEQPCEREPSNDEKQLREFIQKEHNSIVFYAKLSERTRGRTSQVLRSHMMDEKRHLRNLQLEFFLLTGDSCAPEPVKIANTGIMSQLRDGFMAEAAAAAGYKKAASETSAAQLRELYLANAEDELRHKRENKALIMQALL